MECNKDEAARSKEIAEGKFLQHDLAGAKKFALKARHLFPELDGLPQFVSVLDVHIIAQEKLNGVETNWYGILQVDPTADDATIRKQYRKLALLLHPDKNKSVGAEAAFKLISEAWGVLSDKTKKAAHDMRRNAKTSQSSKVTPYKETSATANGCHNVTRPSTGNQSQPQSQPQPQPHQHQPQPQPPPDPRNFWTACPSCKMQFEYQRIYENKNLCCPMCYKPFLAREVAVSGTTWWPPQEQPNFRMDAGGAHHHANGFVNGIKSNAFVNGNCPWGAYGNAAAAHVMHQMNERARKESVGAQKEVRRKEQKEQQQKKRERDTQNKAKAAAKAKEVFDRLIARSKGVIEQKLSSDKAAASERKAASDHAAGSEHKVWQEQSVASGCKVASEPLSASGLKAASGKATTVETLSPKKDSEKPVRASKSQSNGNDGEVQEKRVAEETEDADKVPHEQVGTPGLATSKIATRKSPRGKRNTSNRSACDLENQGDFSPAKKARADPQVPFDAQVLKEHCRGREDTVHSKPKSFGSGTEQTSAQMSEMDQKCDAFKAAKGEKTEEPKENGGHAAAREAENLKEHEDMGDYETVITSRRHSFQVNSPDWHVTSETGHSLKTASSKNELELNSIPVAADAMNVPDADFYDFDKDRTEQHFLVGQIWAAYDDDDGMPRYYARISKVISLQPFKIQMSWLEARAPSDETMAWLESGFSYTCGEYKLGKTITSEYVNTFSHLVTFEKGQRGGFRIYPRKGDVWALYKDWNTLKAKDAKHGYDMVEVLTDFKEEVGVEIMVLVKIEGFKTLFQNQAGSQNVQWISSKELLRFSHQVPAHRLNAEQAPGIQEGCWELDPASTPMDLITGCSAE